MSSPVVVVTYPHALNLEIEQLDHPSVPEHSSALAYYFRGGLIARGVVSDDAVDSIRSLVNDPVHLALAAQEDDRGNIEGRLCLVLPMELGKQLMKEDEDEPDEPWKSSIPAPPSEIDSYGGSGGTAEEGEERPQIALLPIGNIVRSNEARNHPDDVSEDAREMLVNLLTGHGHDAVQKAIDDLLGSL